MAQIWITEYRGSAYGNGRCNNPQVPAGQLGTLTVAITGSASTLSISSQAQLLMISLDAGAFLLFGSSGSTVIPTATNAERLPAGNHMRGVGTPGPTRIFVIST